MNVKGCYLPAHVAVLADNILSPSSRFSFLTARLQLATFEDPQNTILVSILYCSLLLNKLMALEAYPNTIQYPPPSYISNTGTMDLEAKLGHPKGRKDGPRLPGAPK
jgi:hypothetical protein